jgi:hypothetical protein
MGATAARRTRHSRVGRVVAVLSVFVAVIAAGAAAAPGGSSDDPASVPEAAPAARPSPTPSPRTDPLAAPMASGDRAAAPPASAPGGAPATAPPPAPTPTVSPLRAAGAKAARVTDTTSTWASFTLVDRRTGARVGDARSAQRTNTESTVKAWLAADLLATRAAAGRALTSYERTRMASMIRLSDDNAAEVIWRWLGADASIRKMIRTCRLADTRVYSDWWSLTQISSRDLAALGACIIPGRGRFLSPAVGAPLIELMRTVDASNAFGIPQVRPAGAGRVAVKNGWTEHGGTGLWNVNCLGIWGPGDRWVLAVTTRYPIARGLDYGAAVCRRVTAALFPLVRS